MIGVVYKFVRLIGFVVDVYDGGLFFFLRCLILIFGLMLLVV